MIVGTSLTKGVYMEKNDIVLLDNPTIIGIQKKLEDHDERFDEIDEKLEEHSKKLAEHDRRFDEVDRRFDEIDKKLEDLSEIKIIVKRIQTALLDKVN